ncbi:MAG: periplasmic heavy metal sensor [Aquimonas sp.]|nr:periplasmic heavy metal sensor [Aquimonas sp.]
MPAPLRWLLLGSLCTNLLLATAVLGWTWRTAVPAQTAPTHLQSEQQLRELPMRRLQRSLGSERRELIQASFAPEREPLRESLRELQQARAQVASALRAQPFEEANLQTALADQRKRELAVAERAHAGLQRLAAQLEPEERERLAQRMAERRTGGRRGRD